MTTAAAQLFRRLTLVCLLSVFAIALLAYLNVLSGPIVGIACAVLASLLFVFDTVADEPQKLPSLQQGLNRLVVLDAVAGSTPATPPTSASAADTSPTDPTDLLAAVQSNPQLLELINTRSDQIYLLKLRAYLTQQIKSAYERSTLPSLIEELKEAESQLDVLGVDYVALELPERFRELVNQFEGQKRLNIYYSVIDALSFLPFKGLIKLYLRFRLG